jgi:hypothetical protein
MRRCEPVGIAVERLTGWRPTIGRSRCAQSSTRSVPSLPGLLRSPVIPYSHSVVRVPEETRKGRPEGTTIWGQLQEERQHRGALPAAVREAHSTRGLLARNRAVVQSKGANYSGGYTGVGGMGPPR